MTWFILWALRVSDMGSDLQSALSVDMQVGLTAGMRTNGNSPILGATELGAEPRSLIQVLALLPGSHCSWVH